MNARIQIPTAGIEEFGHRWPIRELALFGSALRDDFNAQSDIDLLVDFLPGASVTFSDLDQMEAELTALFGRTVDLVSRRGLEQSRNELRKQHVLDRTEMLFRAA